MPKSSSNIRVALCITELNVGGAERCLTDLALQLDRSRFAPVVYCLGPPPTDDNTAFAEKLWDSGIPVHFLNARSPWQVLSIVGGLKKLLLIQRPQIVQTFLFHANFVGRLAARRAKVPVVVSGIRVAEHAAKWHLWLDLFTQDMVDRYVCVSRAVADFSANTAHLPAEKLIVIPNGVDLEKYPTEQPADLRRLGVAAGRRAVTFVGRLEQQKGVDWLLETAPHWMAAASDCDLLIVGDGPMRTALEASCQATGIADRVHFLGRRDDVPAILAASSLLTLPSLWEGMPNVVLEAMASRLPVLATDVEGVGELLGTGGEIAERQMVHHGDTPAFVAKLTAILRDPALANRLGRVNRLRAESDFNIAKSVVAYEKLWKLLVADKATKPTE